MLWRLRLPVLALTLLLALPALVPALVLVLFPTAGRRLARNLAFGLAN